LKNKKIPKVLKVTRKSPKTLKIKPKSKKIKRARELVNLRFENPKDKNDKKRCIK
jgi:hypothetical protein